MKGTDPSVCTLRRSALRFQQKMRRHFLLNRYLVPIVRRSGRLVWLRRGLLIDVGLGHGRWLGVAHALRRPLVGLRRLERAGRRSDVRAGRGGPSARSQRRNQRSPRLWRHSARERTRDCGRNVGYLGVPIVIDRQEGGGHIGGRTDLLYQTRGARHPLGTGRSTLSEGQNEGLEAGVLDAQSIGQAAPSSAAGLPVFAYRSAPTTRIARVRGNGWFGVEWLQSRGCHAGRGPRAAR